MRNSTILLLAAVVVLVWFGSEVATAQEICATTCISLVGLNVVEQAVAVAVLPVLLLIVGIRLRKAEKSLETVGSKDKMQNDQAQG